MSLFDNVDNSAFVQQMDKLRDAAVAKFDAACNGLFNMLVGVLDDKMPGLIAGLGDKIGQSMSNVQMGFGNMKSNLASLNPFGKERGLEGPSIEKAITPSMEQGVAAVSAPPPRNEKFDQLLASAGVQKMNLQAMDMDSDNSLSGATSVFMGQQKTQSAGIGV